MYNDFTLPDHFAQDDNDRFLQSLQDYAPTEDIQPYVEEMPNKTEAFLAKDGIKSRMAVKTDFPPLQTVQPLSFTQKKTAPFPLYAMGTFADAVSLIADTLELPHASVAINMLSTLALCAQGHANVVLNGRETPLSLFVMTIAHSGIGKTSLDKMLTKPVYDFEEEKNIEYEKALSSWNITKKAFEAEVKKIERSSASFEDKTKKLIALGKLQEKPRKPKLLYNNATIEGLYKRFLDGLPSAGLFADEGANVFGGYSMRSEQRLSTIGILSDLYSSGKADKVRSGEEFTCVKGVRLSVNIMLQPVVVNPLLSDKLLMEQGFFARFLMVEIPQRASKYNDFNITNRKEILDYYNTCMELLHKELQFNESGGLVFQTIELSEEAKQVYIDTYNTVEENIQEGKPYHKVYVFGKRVAEQALRMAGIFTLAEGRSFIDEATMQRAVQIALWCLDEIVRILESVNQEATVSDAEKILSLIKKKWGKEPFETRSVAQYSHIKTERANEGLTFLAENGHIIKQQKSRWVLV